MTDRLIDRIGALLAKAESTDSEHERDALISKAQELATQNAISLELARQRKTDKAKRERPVQKSIQLFPLDDKSKTRSLFILLWVAIARENDCQVNIYSSSTGVIVFGFPSDIEVVETLYTSLSVQMVTAAGVYLKSGTHKNETVVTQRMVRDHYWGVSRIEEVIKPLSGQTARRNFYEGFSSTVSERLRTARLEQEAKNVDVDDSNEPPAFFEPTEVQSPLVKVTGELVLREKREEVADFYKASSRARGSYRGGRTHARSGGALNAGRDAGRRARLGGGDAGIGGKKAIG